ncbi:MAG TPA: BamA/TamA family outer membrane protein [Longimicrobiales bacterium]|nr:BamA/TamA family outer membrane protein [Longimicrobiales bacterium]
MPACLCPAMAMAVVLAAAPGPARGQGFLPAGPEVEELEFQGPRAFPEQLLRSAIVTAESGCLSPVLAPLCLFGIARQPEYLDEDVLRADVVRLRLFYYERGYRDAVVRAETDPTDDGVRVRFLIREGEPVRVREVVLEDPAGVFPPGGPVLPLAAGDPFDLLRYEASRDTLVARLRNRGYAHAEVLSTYLLPADSARQAFVSYEVLPGPRARFGPIEVVGAREVSPSVVRRLLSFREGDPYSDTELLRSQRNLFGLDIFQHAQIRADLDALPDTVVPVRVEVNEGDVHRVRFGVGMSTADCAHAEGSWASRNFLGGARRLEVRGRVSNLLAGELSSFPCLDTGGGIYDQLAGLVAVDFTQPWVFGRRNSLGAGIFAERRSVPDVFVRTSRGGYVSLTRSLGSRTSASVGFRPELTALEAEGDLIFCVTFTTCDVSELEVLREAHWLAPLTLRVQRDRTTALFAPTGGDILRLDVELAGTATGSDFSYTRVVAEWSWYHEVAAGVVLAQRVRPGWARGTDEPGREGLGLHPEKRFFAGGPHSVRGYAQYRLGPRVLTVDAARVLALPVDSGGAGCPARAINDGTCNAEPVAPARFDSRPVGGAAVLEGNLELRFPLRGDRLRGAAFVDYGQVWSTDDEVSLKELRWTPGLGVRYHSPIGPVRVDVGYAPPRTEPLSVVTTRVCTRVGEACLTPMPGLTYAHESLRNTTRLVRLDDPLALPAGRGLFDRLQLHFSIGQAF